MSAGFRRLDSRGRLLTPAVRSNARASHRGPSGGPSKKFSGLLPSSSPKYHRLRPREDHHQQQSQTYVFGHVDIPEEADDEDEDNDDDEIEVFELPEIRSRRNQGASKKSKTGSSEPAYVLHPVADGDTVQSLSIKYDCPISELKRVNLLIRDQDLFGLKHIKVPVKKYGIISEGCEQRNLLLSTDATQLASSQSGCTDGHEESHFKSCETWTDTDSEMSLNAMGDSCNFSDPDTQRRVIQTLSIKDMMQSQSKEAEEFLRNMDRDLEILRESTRTNRHSLDEVISVLTNKSIQPLSKSSNYFGCGDGADCGLRYKNIVAAVLTIAIVVPLLLFLFYKYSKN